MHRTLVGDLHEPPALLGVELAAENDGTLDAVDLAFLGLAVSAICGVDLGMAELDRHPAERQRLVLGIKPQRHRRAGSQPCQQQIIRTGPASGPPAAARPAGQESIRPDRTLLLEAPLPRPPTTDGPSPAGG